MKSLFSPIIGTSAEVDDACFQNPKVVKYVIIAISVHVVVQNQDQYQEIIVPYTKSCLIV